MKLFFVYGTLKETHYNHSILKRLKAKKINDCITIEKYPMYVDKDPFPYLRNKKGIGHYIKGELYEISDSFEKELDYFEGVPNLYKKGLIDVKTSNETFLNVNCYFESFEEIDINNYHLIEEYL